MSRERFQVALELTLAVYLLIAVTTPVGGFWMPDFGARYLVMENLQWTPEGLEAPISYPGHELDPDDRLFSLPVDWAFHQRADGRYDAWFGIWFPLVSWLPFRVLGVGGLVILPLLSGMAICLLAGLIAEQWRPGRGWLAVLLTAFATPVAFYSQLFWDHTPSVACALGGCYVLMRAARPGLSARALLARGALGVGLLLAAAVLRREMLVAQVVGAAWLVGYPIVRRRRPWLPHLAIALLGIGSILLAQQAWIAPSRPLGLVAGAGPRLADGAGFGASAPPLLYAGLQAHGWLDILWTGVLRLVAVAYNTGSSQALAIPSLGWLTGLALLLAIASFFARGRWKWIGLAVSSLVMAVPAGVNAFSPRDIHSVHGLVLAAPLVLAAIALASWRQPAALLLYGAACGFVLGQAVIVGVLALEWGPRVALFVYPVCAVVVATAAVPRQTLSRALGLAAVGLLVACSAATQMRGLRVLRADMAYLSSWTAGLQHLPSMVLATDQWWLTLAVTPAYRHQEFVYVNEPEQAAYLYEHIGSRPLAYLGILGEHIPLDLGRYFEPVSAQGFAGPSGPALWVIELRPRPTPLPAAAAVLARVS